MALPLPFNTQGLPTVNAIVFAGAGASNLGAGAPTHGVTVTVNTDNSTLIATVQVGRRYRVAIVGGDGVVVANAAAAARATDEPWWNLQRFELVAVATTIYAQKLVIGTANLNVTVVPLDGGTIA